MKKITSGLTIALALMFLFSQTAVVSAASRISESRAIQIAEDRYTGDGEYTDIELETEDGVEIYEVEFTEDNGDHTDIEINARTGSVISVENEGPEDCDDEDEDDDEDEGGEEDDDETETPITGSALARASRVALDHVGSGRVTETEMGDEESYYEVEVTLNNGNQIDVQLDRDFNVVGQEEDGQDDDNDEDEDISGEDQMVRIERLMEMVLKLMAELKARQ